MRELNVAAFGGCQVNGPIRVLRSQRRVNPVYRLMGFQDTPFVFTVPAALQLIRFCNGEQAVPREIREFCYSDAECEPRGEAQDIMRNADAALLEPNTPIDLSFDGYFLNQNILQQLIVARARQIDPVLGKLAHKWKADGLLKQREELRAECAAKLLKTFPCESESDRLIHQIFKGCRGVRASEDDLYRQVSEYRELLSMPTGIVLYTFQYMPDGRPISWPAEFKDQMTSVAKRSGMRLYDPSPMVAQYGTEVALREDVRHYRDDFYVVVADILMEFLAEVLSDHVPGGLASGLHSSLLRSEIRVPPS